jgi:hypothetical protein
VTARVVKLKILALTAIIALSALGSDSAKAVSSEELSIWAAGPVQWLLLPDERKELRRALERSDDSDLVESFWARRDALTMRMYSIRMRLCLAVLPIADGC